MPPFPGLTRPKIPENVKEEVPVYETNADVRKFLKAQEEAAKAAKEKADREARQKLYQEHFGTKKGGRRTRGKKSMTKKAKAKSRRRK